MIAATEKIILELPISKMAAFLEILKQYEFVKVKDRREILEKFIQNAPKNVPLTDDDIVAEVMEHRYGKTQS